MYSLKPEHLPKDQRKILRERAGKRQDEAVNAVIAEYRRLSPFATGDKLAVSGEVNRIIDAAINANPQCFWHGPDA
jgi:hypothetical protein